MDRHVEERVKEFLREVRRSQLFHPDEVNKMKTLIAYGNHDGESLAMQQRIHHARNMLIEHFADVIKPHQPKLWKFLLTQQGTQQLRLAALAAKVNPTLTQEQRDRLAAASPAPSHHSDYAEQQQQQHDACAGGASTVSGFGNGLRSLKRQPLGSGFA